MKLMTGCPRGSSTPTVFAVTGDRATALDTPATELGALIAAEAAGTPLPRPAPDASSLPLAEITPTLPIAQPGKILCLGLNYAAHAREGGHEVPDYPALFMRAASSLVPSGAPMVLPTASTAFDYEAELMVVIGKPGRHIAEADALDHVFGYTTFNDGSIRDYQFKTPQWTPGKNFDATGAVGPIVVTADEIPDGASALQIQTRVNGETLQNSNTSDMIFTVPRALAIISEIMTLSPGDMIAFGTPEGVGQSRTPPRWLTPGDTVEVEIEGIGTCRNPIIAEADLT